MIVQQSVLGTVRSSIGVYFFTDRWNNTFQAVRPTEVVECDDGWAFLSPKTIEVCGDYIVEHSPRSIPVFVTAEYINREIELAEEANGEMTWEIKVEVDELLKEY